MEDGMKHWKPAHAREARAGLDIIKTHVMLVALAAAAAAPIALLSSLIPRSQGLPLFCLLALTGASLVALVAWWRRAPRHGDQVTLWDVAGALALIGFAAGMLSDTNSILSLFGFAAT
jgi:hypothetical protein